MTFLWKIIDSTFVGCVWCGMPCQRSKATFQWVLEPSSPPPSPFPHQPCNIIQLLLIVCTRLHVSNVKIKRPSRLVIWNIIQLDANTHCSKPCKKKSHYTEPGKLVIPLPCIALEASVLHFSFKSLISANRSSLVPVCKIDLNVK